MKKLFISSMAFVFASAMLVSCGTSNPGSNGSSSLSDKVTISFWTKSDSKIDPILKNLVNTYNQTNTDNIYVEFSPLENVSDYNDLETTVITGFNTNIYPNLVQAYPGHVADYMNYNKAVNLDKYINDSNIGWTSEEKTKFDLSSGQQFAVEGTYTLPFNKSTEVLYYNRDKLVGLDISSYYKSDDGSLLKTGRISDTYLQNLTWEEFYNYLCPALLDYNKANNDALLNTSKDNYAILNYESDANHFITMLKQYGISYTHIDETTKKGAVDFDSDESIKFMSTIREYAQKHYIMTKYSTGSPYYSATSVFDGNALFAINSTVGASYFADNTNPISIGIGHIPYAEGKDKYVIEQGTSLAALDKGEEQNKATWLFYKWLSNYENALNYSISSGYLPLRSDVYEDVKFKETFNPENYTDKTSDKVVASVISYTTNLTGEYFTEAPFIGSSSVRNAASYLNSWLLKVIDRSEDEIKTEFIKYADQGRLDIK